jgi:hypothetical protein
MDGGHPAGEHPGGLGAFDLGDRIGQGVPVGLSIRA